MPQTNHRWSFFIFKFSLFIQFTLFCFSLHPEGFQNPLRLVNGKWQMSANWAVDCRSVAVPPCWRIRCAHSHYNCRGIVVANKCQQKLTSQREDKKITTTHQCNATAINASWGRILTPKVWPFATCHSLSTHNSFR